MRKLFWKQRSGPGPSRRELFRRGGLLAAAQAFGGRIQRASAAALDIGANLYQSIGVRPILNARGTFTIITGSLTLPEVKRAMDEASRHFVQMDELMEGVSKRLAELTGAEWGIVTAGCCAALTHCTAAAIAGNNPERMQRLPDLTGLEERSHHPRLLAQRLRSRHSHVGREDRRGARTIANSNRRSTSALPWFTFSAATATMARWGRA